MAVLQDLMTEYEVASRALVQAEISLTEATTLVARIEDAAVLAHKGESDRVLEAMARTAVMEDGTGALDRYMEALQRDLHLHAEVRVLEKKLKALVGV